MEPSPQHYPVVGVGSGPIGLTLVNLLGTLGVRSLIVERNPTTVQEPRAVSIDDESLRTMQAAGVADEVLKFIVPGYGSHYYAPGGICFAKVEPTRSPRAALLAPAREPTRGSRSPAGRRAGVSAWHLLPRPALDRVCRLPAVEAPAPAAASRAVLARAMQPGSLAQRA